jgi:hemolysin III
VVRGYENGIEEPPVAGPRHLDVPLGSPSRPSWRGRLHLLALVAVTPALVLLAVDAHGARARAGVIVYAAGLCSMLAASTTYHRWVHTVRSRSIWRRVDHAVIYAAIAGTFTPICLTLLGTGWAIAVLVTVWAAAATGAALKLSAWRHADRIGTALYIAIGWAGVVVTPVLLADRGVLPLVLLFAGGVIFTVGAVGFGRQWPRLRPSVFSYHEVWHAMTIAAAGSQLVAIWIVVT